MTDNTKRWADEIASAVRRAKRLAVPKQDSDGPNVYLRYRAERSLEAVLRAIGSDPSIQRTLQN